MRQALDALGRPGADPLKLRLEGGMPGRPCPDTDPHPAHEWVLALPISSPHPVAVAVTYCPGVPLPAAPRRPVDQALFDRTAPAWNCIAYPHSGMHLMDGDACSWCGVGRVDVEAKMAAGPGPQPCPEAQGVCPVCGRQLPFRYGPPRQLVIGQHANVGGDPCAGAGRLPVAWRMPGGGPVPAGLRRRPIPLAQLPPVHYAGSVQPAAQGWPQEYTSDCLACCAPMPITVHEPGGPATGVCACGLACTWSYDPRRGR
jgi:hypothetical protein